MATKQRQVHVDDAVFLAALHGRNATRRRMESALTSQSANTQRRRLMDHTT